MVFDRKGLGEEVGELEEGRAEDEGDGAVSALLASEVEAHIHVLASLARELRLRLQARGVVVLMDDGLSARQEAEESKQAARPHDLLAGLARARRTPPRQSSARRTSVSG